MAETTLTEVMAELATPYPSQVFLTLFGLPLEDRERLIAWKDAIIAFSLTTDPSSVDLTPAVDRTRTPTAALSTSGRTVALTPGSYLRAEVRSADGALVGFSNPVWVLGSEPATGIPANRRL